jgi:hypothetical protein
VVNVNEFGNIVIGAHRAVGRRGVCIRGGLPSGDRCISGGGGQVWVDDLDTGVCAQVVEDHCAAQGE